MGYDDEVIYSILGHVCNDCWDLKSIPHSPVNAQTKAHTLYSVSKKKKKQQTRFNPKSLNI